MNVLAIDTGSGICSVAVWADGRLAERQVAQPRAHADHVLDLVEKALSDAGIALGKIERYAFSLGPGGLTGLRIAASVIQGFALVHDRPVVPVSHLDALAHLAVLRQPAAARVLACHDAGLGQVCWQAFDVTDGRPLARAPAQLAAPDEIDVGGEPGRWWGVGTGCKLLGDRRDHLAGVIGADVALAGIMARLAARPEAPTVAATEAQPHYFRHPVTG